MEMVFNQAIQQDDKNFDSDCDVVFYRLLAIEWTIRDRYGDKLNISPHRIAGYIKKHITHLRSRDSLFEQYYTLYNRLHAMML